MKTSKILIFVLLVFCFTKAQAEENLHLDKPMIVSLGSHCEVAMHISHNKMRTAAFPFDWLLTFDHCGFLLVLEDDFSFFMDKFYLQQQREGNIVNTYYNIDYRHDWPNMDFEKPFLEIREKYERRINRFRSLNDYKGKVYFMRAAFDLNINPLLPTITKECSKIDSFQAASLRNMLKRKFPNLDFYLIIVNYVEEHTPDLVKMDRIMEFKVRKSQKKEDYTAIINKLITHAGEI